MPSKVIVKVWVFLITLLLARLLLFWYLTPPPSFVSGSDLNLQGTIGSEPITDRGAQRFELAGVAIRTEPLGEYHYSDKIIVSGKIDCPINLKTCPHPVMNRPRIQLVGRDSQNPWFASAFRVRDSLQEIYFELLPRDQANLLTGVLIGNMSLDREFRNKLANVGLTHIVAASGMNVTLVAGFIVGISAAIRIKKIYKLLLIIVFVTFYSTVTGFEPPIVRACLMSGLVLFSSLLGRPGSAIFALLASAYLMLWVDPGLLSSASFWLSFTAMIGQISASSLKVNLPKVLIAITDNFFQSSAAIITTFPIVLIFFSKFSLISTITNILVLWTVEPLMLIGAIAGIIGIINHNIAGTIMLPAGILLEYFLKIVDTFNREEFLVSLPTLNRVEGLSFVLGYYLTLGSVYILWKNRQVSQKLNLDRTA